MGYYLTEIEGMVFLQLFNCLFLQLPIVRVEDALPVMDTGTIQPSAGLDTRLKAVEPMPAVPGVPKQ